LIIGDKTVMLCFKVLHPWIYKTQNTLPLTFWYSCKFLKLVHLLVFAVVVIAELCP